MLPEIATIGGCTLCTNFNYILLLIPGIGVCPETISGSRFRPANPHDRDRDLKPRHSRDREKNPAQFGELNAPIFFCFNIIQLIYVETRGTRVPICPDTFCVPLDRDRSLRDERDRDKFSRDYPNVFVPRNTCLGKKSVWRNIPYPCPSLLIPWSYINCENPTQGFSLRNICYEEFENEPSIIFLRV